MVDYAKTLSKSEAAEHFRGLLGDSPDAIEFISTFNAQRRHPKVTPAATASITSTSPSSFSAPPPLQQNRPIESAPKPTRTGGGRRKLKNKADIHTPPARQIANAGPLPGTAYNKRDLDEEYTKENQSQQRQKSNGLSSIESRTRTPPAVVAASSSTGNPKHKPPKQPPSAAGTLISDIGKAKEKKKPSFSSSSANAKTSTIATKVTVTGGTPMQGASTAIADLDAAIRALEITTNPSLASSSSVSTESRRCNCVATRHPLQSAAPNCLSCGKVICLKEGLEPCTSCGSPLLAPEDVKSMIQELKADRGRERMAVDRKAHKKADIGKTPAPFERSRGNLEDVSSGSGVGGLAAAEAQRDKLLGFQAQNARRTTVRDEAADFDYEMALGFAAGGGIRPEAGSGNIWASPEERARELKRQQKIMREMEWNAQPDYEKRQQVVSIDLIGGKIVRTVTTLERPKDFSFDSVEEEEKEEFSKNGESTSHPAVLCGTSSGGGRSSGTFRKNPLLSGVIRPTYEASGKGKSAIGRETSSIRKGWRRVQMDSDDNTAIILDGGVYGDRKSVV